MAQITEKLQALIPEYPINIAGKDFTLRLDVNTNKTKKGIKLQFVSNDLPQDVRQKQRLANQIGTELQTKFGEAGIQVILDLENPYNNVIGFLIPLPSIANYIVGVGFPELNKGQQTQPEQEPEAEVETELEAEALPAEETPPSEEDQDIKEMFKWRAGIK